MVSNLIEYNPLGRHQHEPTTVLCRRGEVMRWTGWGRRVLDDMVAVGTLKVKTHQRPNSGRVQRMYYTAQIKAELEKENYDHHT